MKSITIIFKTHLDIGFTGLAEDVCKAYPGYIRNAVATANAFRAKDPSPSGFRYRWTVGSWLIDSFFEQADESDRAFLEKAIRDGDILWHAMPFTTESETVGLSVFRAGLRRSADLNARFGKQIHSAKLTDVPGHTRGIIGPFVEAGITFLHIGTNPGCGVCDLPEAFRWRDSKAREILVVYQTEYGKLLELPGGKAFLISVANDNLGAHSVEAVETLLAELHQAHPKAKLSCGTLDDLAEALDAIRETLPVVTSEIGSTWVHSAGTDPWKIAHYRECVRWAELQPRSRDIERFLRDLGLVTEHTGGLDTKTFLRDTKHWAGSSILKLANPHPSTAEIAHKRDRKDNGFALSVRSWDEQREYIDRAKHNLFLRSNIMSLNRALAPLKPSLRDIQREGFTRIENPAATIETPQLTFSFDLDHGCLKNLRRPHGPTLFKEAFRLSCEYFGPKDYERYHERYLRLQCPWTHADFGKPGMPERPYSIDDGFPAILWTKKIYGGNLFILRNAETSRYIKDSGPLLQQWEAEFYLPDSSPEIDATIRFLGKNPSRSAHAFWCSFAPAPNQGKLSFTKLGEPIDPSDVVPGGGRSLHAIDGTLRLASGISLESLDAPLLAPGKRDLLWAHNNPLPKPGEPFHFNLYNNIWGCNFPMWFGDDMLYRFTLNLP